MFPTPSKITSLNNRTRVWRLSTAINHAVAPMCPVSDTFSAPSMLHRTSLSTSHSWMPSEPAVVPKLAPTSSCPPQGVAQLSGPLSWPAVSVCLAAGRVKPALQWGWREDWTGTKDPAPPVVGPSRQTGYFYHTARGQHERFAQCCIVFVFVCVFTFKSDPHSTCVAITAHP